MYVCLNYSFAYLFIKLFQIGMAVKHCKMLLHDYFIVSDSRPCLGALRRLRNYLVCRFKDQRFENLKIDP